MRLLLMFRKRIFKFLAKNFPWNIARILFLKWCNCDIGKNVYIGEDILLIDDLDDPSVNVSIGDRVAIAPRVTIAVNSYPNKSILRKYFKDRKGIIKIENDAWIGTGSIILGGVTINEGGVVAANSVVDKDVPKFTIVGGTPAKEIRKIDIPFIDMKDI
jgi:acetyltransferase-like isoleucine patch superfamily enzyme